MPCQYELFKEEELFQNNEVLEDRKVVALVLKHFHGLNILFNFFVCLFGIK